MLRAARLRSSASSSSGPRWTCYGHYGGCWCRTTPAPSPGDGREVIKRREKEPEGDGLPPGHARIASPYDADARWGVKREELWLGYKLHVTETCDDEPRCGCPAATAGLAAAGMTRTAWPPAFPNLIAHVATTGATVTDNQMTSVIHDELTGKTLAPGRHYLDSGALQRRPGGHSEAARHGIALIGPLLADTSAQARAGPATPAPTSPSTTAARPSPARRARPQFLDTVRQRGNDTIVATFPSVTASPARYAACAPPAEDGDSSRCRPATWPKPRPPPAPRKRRTVPGRLRRRAGIEGTMHQAVSRGARRARYRGLPKTRLDHRTWPARST